MVVAERIEAREVERAELDAVRDVFLAGREARYDVAVEELSGALCPVCRLLPDDADVNRVLGLGLDAPATEETVDAIVDLYRRSGTVCAVAVAPHARPAELADWLVDRGFAPGEPYAAYGIRPSRLPAVESPFSLEPLTPDLAPEFARVVVEAYGLPASHGAWVEAVVQRPGWVSYVAFAGREIVAVSAMFVSGPRAWLAYAATLPRFRRRGSQRLMFAARMEEAVRRGVETLAGAPGADRRESLLRKGMRVVYDGTDYVLATARTR